MSEFERECEEYGCPPVTTQWGKVVDMLLAQAKPKNHKKEKRMCESKWSQICIENGWDNPDKMSVALLCLIKITPTQRVASTYRNSLLPISCCRHQ